MLDYDVLNIIGSSWTSKFKKKKKKIEIPKRVANFGPPSKCYCNAAALSNLLLTFAPSVRLPSKDQRQSKQKQTETTIFSKLKAAHWTVEQTSKDDRNS